jgi:hypothetical protein
VNARAPDHWTDWAPTFTRAIYFAAAFLLLACLIVTTTQPWANPNPTYGPNPHNTTTRIEGN